MIGGTRKPMTTSDNLQNIIEIRDPDVDVVQIMKQIRENLAQRATIPDVDFPSFFFTRYQIDADTPGYFDDETYYNLEQANLTFDQIWIDSNLILSTIPLLGQLINRIKQELHNLVIYYVNLMAGIQVTFNEHILRVVNSVVEKSSQDHTQSDIVKLQNRIVELEQRLTQLESQEFSRE